ncbi:hypothetical protein HMPREF0793_1609 [Staphylococcus caprae M23864:W1]|nr:hypothetical protein HMPREF0793_1609 [Staphylococcus caprae M23864:W1]
MLKINNNLIFKHHLPFRKWCFFMNTEKAVELATQPLHTLQYSNEVII